MITNQQRANLLKAIELAERPGVCQYVISHGEDMRPCCVIGQLAYLEGVTLDKLLAWDTGGEDVAGVISLRRDGYERIEVYPLEVLQNLQLTWDSTSTSRQLDEAGKREKMREYVS